MAWLGKVCLLVVRAYVLILHTVIVVKLPETSETYAETDLFQVMKLFLRT